MEYNRSLFIFASLAIFCCLAIVYSAAAEQQNIVVRMISPIPDTEIITKHPDIQAVFDGVVDSDSLIIVLDDTDITATAEITENGFRCRVPILIPSGIHLIYIEGDSDTGHFKQEIRFSSRQYATLDEAYTRNEWTLNLETGRLSGNRMEDYSFTGLDSTLEHESVVKKNRWQVTLTGNLRLLEKDRSGILWEQRDVSDEAVDPDDAEYPAPAEGEADPEREGLDLNQGLLRAQYQSDKVGAAIELGDLEIVTSKNTFGTLTRNGGQLIVDFNSFYLGGFSVFGGDTFGVRNGIGVGFDNDDHLNGFTGGLRLFKKKMDIRAFYMDGGQKENSYSSWSREEQNSGNIYGVVMTTDFFKKVLTSEFEYNYSNFSTTADGEDHSESNNDDAWRFQLGGQLDPYQYSIIYEHFGDNYDIPGQLSPKKDYDGISVIGGFWHRDHNIRAVLSAYHDNVDSDPLYARIRSLAGQFDYVYSRFTTFPLMLNYQHTTDNSTDEPENSREMDLTTDTVTLTASYVGQGHFTNDFLTGYSFQNDRSDADTDVATFSISISPGLSYDTFSVRIGGTLNQNRDVHSGIRTDDYLFTLDASGSLFSETLAYEFGGTYEHTINTDDSGDRKGFTGYSKINYHFPWLVDAWHPKFGIGIEYKSNELDGESIREETRVYGTLSTTVPFSY